MSNSLLNDHGFFSLEMFPVLASKSSIWQFYKSKQKYDYVCKQSCIMKVEMVDVVMLFSYPLVLKIAPYIILLKLKINYANQNEP